MAEFKIASDDKELKTAKEAKTTTSLSTCNGTGGGALKVTEPEFFRSYSLEAQQQRGRSCWAAAMSRCLLKLLIVHGIIREDPETCKIEFDKIYDWLVKFYGDQGQHTPSVFRDIIGRPTSLLPEDFRKSLEAVVIDMPKACVGEEIYHLQLQEAVNSHFCRPVVCCNSDALNAIAKDKDPPFLVGDENSAHAVSLTKVIIGDKKMFTIKNSYGLHWGNAGSTDVPSFASIGACCICYYKTKVSLPRHYSSACVSYSRGISIWGSDEERPLYGYKGDTNSKGRPHGQGIKISISGCKYEGSWFNGMQHGFGRYTYKLGSVYSGNWESNQKHGKGVWTCGPDCPKEKHWVNGEYTGKGRALWPRGMVYDGDWLNNKVSPSLFIWPLIPTIYITQLTKSQIKATGYGTFIFANGDSYSGGVKEGLYHGEGIITLKDGRIINGSWQNGKR